MTWDQMIRYVEGLSDEEAERAHPGFLKQLRNFRVMFRDLCRRTGQIGPTGILSMCGSPPGELAKALRHSHGRITPAQLLGAFLGYIFYGYGIESVGNPG